jgi:hypothetical protein
MWRSVGLLALGIAVGAAATYYSIREGTDALESGRTITDSFAVGATREATTQAPRARISSVGERATLYERVADGDIAAIERLARIDGDLLVAAYRALAENDPNAALAALSRIDDPRQATAIGLALLPVLGNDARAIETIAARLDGNSKQFRLDAFAARTAIAPHEALHEALALADRGMALPTARSVITAWAGRDAEAALTAIETIDDMGVQFELQRIALNAWAAVDPEALVDYLAKLEPERQQSLLARGGVQLLASVDPARVFELANRLPPESSTMLRIGAFMRFASEDPLAALAYADTMPAGPQRQQLYQQAAQAYGRKDPDAALAWARNLRPPIPGLLATVFMGIGQRDPSRAIDLAMTIESPNERMQAVQRIMMFGAAGRASGETRAVADKILTLPDNASRRSMLQMLTQRWAAQSPKEAAEWLLAHREQVDVEVFAQIGSRFGQQDPGAAASYLDRVPVAVRMDWMSAIAVGYARTDPQSALSWIAQFRGEPAYDWAAAAVAQTLVGHDPQGAAALARTIDMSRPELHDVMARVARQWAMTDPYGAADWALEFDDAEARSNALTGIAGAWASYDTRAARNWALTMPAGANRDAALTGAVQMIGSAESLDQALLGAFSSDRVRQQAIMRAMPSVAQRDVDEARRLLDDHLSDPSLRRQAEQLLAAHTPQGRISNTALNSTTVVEAPLSAPPLGVSPAGIAPPMMVPPPTVAQPPRREAQN